MIDKNNILQGYKSSVVGIIPEEWEVKRLGEVCVTFKSGTTITSQSIRRMGLYPVYGGNGLRGYADSYTHDGTYILIGRQGALCGNINFVSGKIYISEHAIAVQPDETTSIRYLRYKLDFWNLNRFSESSAQPGLSVEKLVRYRLAIPPLAEQKKIAEILYTWDDAIEKQSKLIDKLELRKRGLMQRLLTGNTRLPGFTEPWKKIKLGDVCCIVTGRLDANAMVSNGEYPFFTCAKEVYKINNYSFDTEALLVSGNGEYVGYVHYYKGKFNAYQRTYVLDGFNCNIFYMYYALKQYLPKRIMRTKSNSNTPYIVKDTLFDMELLLPSDVEQKLIAKLISSADKEIETQRKKLEALRQQKQGLMQQLLTGKTRVKVS